MPAASAEFISAMRRFPGAVNLITTGTGDQRIGFTATACMSLTADPPQVGIAVGRTVSGYPHLIANRYFCINTLANDHFPLAQRFSGPIKGAERFQVGNWATLATGAPALEDAVVNLDCELAEQHELSTHTLFVGRVLVARQRSDANPLLYIDGDWASLLPATSKDVENAMDGIDRSIAAIDNALASSSDPAVRFDRFIRDWAKVCIDQHQAAQRYMSADLYISRRDIESLSAARRAFDHKLTDLLAEGKKEGYLDVEDPRLTAFAITGLFGWIHKWFRPSGRLTADEIAERLAVLVRRMVERRPAGRG